MDKKLRLSALVTKYISYKHILYVKNKNMKFQKLHQKTLTCSTEGLINGFPEVLEQK